MSATLDDIRQALYGIQATLGQLMTNPYPIGPDQITIVQGLSDIDGSLGIVQAGEFRTGNGVLPGSGFSGVRIAYPAMLYSSEYWNIAGVSNDVIQFGLRSSDGAAMAGAGTVLLNVDGITIVGTAPSGELGVSNELIKFYNTLGGAIQASFGLSTGLGGGLEIHSWNVADLNITADDALRLIGGTGGTSITQTALSSTQPPPVLTVDPSNHTDIFNGLGTEYNDVLFDLRGSAERRTGAVTNWRSFWIRPRTYAFTGASTITNAATVAIEAAPIAGTNATITNSYALWVQAGLAKFDGGISLTDISLTGDITMASTKWIGLSSSAGRITFTDAATDTILVTNADFGFNVGSATQWAFTWNQSGTGSGQMYMPASTNKIHFQGGGNDNLSIDMTNRRVGIKNASPAVELDVSGTVNATTAYQKSGTQVVGARVTGWTAATNTKSKATFDTTTVTLPNLAARVGQIIDDLIAHGLIGA